MADIAVIAPAVFHYGSVALAPSIVGDRSFVGNGALIPISTQIGENCLLGVYSVPPSQQVEPGTSWLGAPAMFLPRRQESQSFKDDMLYRPRTSLLAWRLFIEFFRVTLPATILTLTTLFAFYAVFTLATVISPLALLCILPLLVWGMGVVATLIVVLLKWIIIGRYRPRVEPLWSVFVRRSELDYRPLRVGCGAISSGSADRYALDCSGLAALRRQDRPARLARYHVCNGIRSRACGERCRRGGYNLLTNPSFRGSGHENGPSQGWRRQLDWHPFCCTLRCRGREQRFA